LQPVPLGLLDIQKRLPLAIKSSGPWTSPSAVELYLQLLSKNVRNKFIPNPLKGFSSFIATF
jgi:hypothetical protein